MPYLRPSREYWAGPGSTCSAFLSVARIQEVGNGKCLPITGCLVESNINNHLTAITAFPGHMVFRMEGKNVLKPAINIRLTFAMYLEKPRYLILSQGAK